MSELKSYLLLAAILFGVGLAAVLTRRNAIVVLAGVEVMLNAANLNFIAFWRFGERREMLEGVSFAIFGIGIAAAEAAVGLALILACYRHYRSANVDDLDRLRG